MSASSPKVTTGTEVTKLVTRSFFQVNHESTTAPIATATTTTTTTKAELPGRSKEVITEQKDGLN